MQPPEKFPFHQNQYCMFKQLFFSLLLINALSSLAQNNQESDRQAINQAIENWDKAWETKDIDLALLDYSNNIDWTNAFGARVHDKAELKALLGKIFAMDFVMAGVNNYGPPDIDFLSNRIATAYSLNIRKNQKWPDGTTMPDRRIAHLRVFQKIDGKWLITHHMISQAHERELE